MCACVNVSPNCTAVDVPLFSGSSYAIYPPLSNTFAITSLSMRIRPANNTGLILYSAQLLKGRDFIALVLNAGVIEFIYDLGTGPVTIRSSTHLTLDQWHTVEAYRQGRSGQLVVDGNLPQTGTSPGSFTSLQLGDNLYLGGVANYSDVIKQVGVENGFHGCIKDVAFGSPPQPLDLVGGALGGTGVTGCSCPSQLCLNGGTCVSNASSNGVCLCPPGFSGGLCEKNPCDTASMCLNGGQCVLNTSTLTGQSCMCSLPYGGGGSCNESECICVCM